MRKSLLLIIAGISSVSFAQNVTENKMSFSFIQLPTNPISTDYSTYNVVIEKKYETPNEDSLNAYSMRLDQANLQYDAQMAVWRDSMKIVKKAHLTRMAAWQKSVNAGTPIAKPVEPKYPIQPVMQEVQEAWLHSELDENQAAQTIQLAGFDRGDGGATITLGILPITNVSIKETIKSSGSSTSTAKKYEYRAYFKLPMELKVEDPSNGVVLQTIILNNVQSYVLGTYGSQYEHDIWWIDNREKFWPDLERKARNIALKEANNIINNKCGYPQRTRSTEIYTVKKFKDHSYNDLINAWTAASQGYQQVGQSKDRSGAEGKLREAISIWDTALKESNVGDKKARVNDKVTALLYVNIAEAYLWLSEFDKAEQYINQAIGTNVRKFKKRAESLRGQLTERKMRWNTNY